MADLGDIELAFRGELTLSESMEALMNDIFFNRVNKNWTKLSFLSERGLSAWLDNLKQRLDQLNAWKDEPTKMPTVVFLNRLYNPNSFLTAIKQVYSRAEDYELNKLYIQTDILKKWYWEADLPPVREGKGAYCFGF